MLKSAASTKSGQRVHPNYYVVKQAYWASYIQPVLYIDNLRRTRSYSSVLPIEHSIGTVALECAVSLQWDDRTQSMTHTKIPTIRWILLLTLQLPIIKPRACSGRVNRVNARSLA